MVMNANTLTAGRAAPFTCAVVTALFFAAFRIAGADIDLADELPYDCKTGCRKAFEPVCGADGRTYSSRCLATCQGIQVAEHGSCPGEQILHPTNKHVVTGGEEGSTLLSPHHINAFRHEGYRYAGQLTFTDDMPARQHSSSSDQQHSASASLALDLDEQTPPARTVRVTREGHMYLADMDESVDKVLETLMQRHGGAADGDAATVNALLNSLRRWRECGSRDGARLQGRGGKLTRHTVVARQTPGERPLQPGLDTDGAAGAFAAQAAPEQGQQPTTTTSQDEQDEQDEHGPAEGTRAWGFGGQQRERHADSRAGGERHRQARRSLGIFDLDDRVDCPRTPTYPFTAMGQISIRDPSGNYVCSGTLVGPDVVLTAAHCVFSRAAQTFYHQLDFAPARYRTLDNVIVNPFDVIPWTNATIYQAYQLLSTPDPNIVDIAVIHLSQRIGVQAGWMGVFEPCSAYAPSRYVALTAGYPSDQPSGSCKATQCVVVQEPCTDGYLYHKCDTASGQSGSPMYMMAMTAARKMGPYVRGVHNIEWVQETASGKTVSYINSAVSITPEHYRTILAWIGLSFSSGGTSPMIPALPPANYMTQISGA